MATLLRKERSNINKIASPDSIAAVSVFEHPISPITAAACQAYSMLSYSSSRFYFFPHSCMLAAYKEVPSCPPFESDKIAYVELAYLSHWHNLSFNKVFSLQYNDFYVQINWHAYCIFFFTAIANNRKYPINSNPE